MSTPPDDRTFRREMATAYRSGWHFIDLATAIPHAGDSLMVTLLGEPVVVTRDDEEEIRAYRCLRKPRGAPQPVRCAIRYGMVFVNLDRRDHQVVGEPGRPGEQQDQQSSSTTSTTTSTTRAITATPRSA
ncbi:MULTISPECIES: hypothetical protein [unclassified Streptomyces]|uniref:hypothetical protein n=1 Tax=unclassified Streptomyces TaxID=2593676 RepID=UPI00332F534A